jgi:hypothetical protein
VTMIPVKQDSSRDENGDWNPPRWMLAAGGALGSVVVWSVFPLDIVPDFVQDDALIHFFSGLSVALLLAALVPVRDDVLVLATMAIGFIWEPIEWFWFMCDWGRQIGSCSTGGLYDWMAGDDTIKDIALVWVGAFVVMVVVGRYE